MQINRLFEIVYLLLEKPILTAGELAERFEVSTRTWCDWFMSYLVSYGDGVEVVSPAEARKQMQELGKKIVEIHD